MIIYGEDGQSFFPVILVTKLAAAVSPLCARCLARRMSRGKLAQIGRVERRFDLCDPADCLLKTLFAYESRQYKPCPCLWASDKKLVRVHNSVRMACVRSNQEPDAIPARILNM
jgi:hypothetical protein